MKVKIFLLALLLSACHGRYEAEFDSIDSLNRVAYDWRYRDVERSRQMAYEALAASEAVGYDAGRAEALNHLAYERFQKMDFDSAMALTRRVLTTTSDKAEHVAAHVMAMKVAQRTSANVTFFAERSQATRLLQARPTPTPSPGSGEGGTAHRLSRLNFVEGELHIVASTYFFYVDQLDRAREEIAEAEPFCQMSADTAQWLYYNYMLGSGGLIESTDADDVTRQEFDRLFKCCTISKDHGYLYFEANALQSLAMMLSDSTNVATLQEYKPEALIYLNIIFPSPTSKNMAFEARELFEKYADDFQCACVLRTLGTLAAKRESYDEALEYYQKALHLVGGRPVYEWKASIMEQMSVAYAGVGNIGEAARLRNNYLDLRELTREDAEMENRLAELREQSVRLRNRIVATCVLAALLVVVVLAFRRWWLGRNAAKMNRVREARQRMIERERERRQQLADAEEELLEQQAATRLRIERDKRQNLVQRAKLSLARDIVPLLDRIIHTARQMLRRGRTDKEGLEYISQLTDRIDELGAMLTDWIQVERGRVALKVTSFPLQPIMDTMRRSHHAFEEKGIRLSVANTALCVKADRALTLFMLNTLADNARKFTDAGGHVDITATEGETPDGQYVELSVTDTGRKSPTRALPNGEKDEQRKDAEKIIENNEKRTTEKNGNTRKEDERRRSEESGSGYGFGLTNCRGIIERYRKTSTAFAVCQMGVESESGRGSRFWFRLPRVAMTMALLLFVNCQIANGKNTDSRDAYRLADSLYFANIDGRHEDALRFAAAALDAVGRWHAEIYPDDESTLLLNPTGATPPELRWLMRGDSIDFEMLIALRNETAVAALCLQQWDIYANNNNVYTRLYKLYNRDASLEADCLAIERSHDHQRLMLWLMAALLIAAAATTYALYLRPQMQLRHALDEIRRQRFNAAIADQERRRAQQQTDVEMAEDEHRRRLFEESRLHVQNQVMDNVLSTIKHETMYYPSRIARLARDEGEGHLQTLWETATYYHDVYTTLIAAAEDAVAQTPFRIQTVSIDNEHKVQADPDLLQMLITTLRDAVQAMTTEGKTTLDISITDDKRYVRYAITNPALELDETARNELFAPRPHETRLLICKQIIREIDTLLGHVGCRIQADAAPKGTTVWFTLPTHHPRH